MVVASETLSSLLMLSFSGTGVGFALLFIAVVISHPQCHTATILLALNSVAAGLAINLTCACQAIYQLKGIADDPLCAFRGYLFYAMTGFLYHTLFIQALHRLFTNVFATNRFLQSTKFVVVVVCIQWIFSNTFVLPLYVTGHFGYVSGSRVCMVSLGDTFSFMYLVITVYSFPLIMTMFCYIFIVRHVKNNSFINTNRPIIFQKRRLERDIRVLRRILMLVAVLFAMCFPYCMFWVYTTVTRYSQPFAERVSLVFTSLGYGLSMVIIIFHTDDVKKIVKTAVINIVQKRQRRRVADVHVAAPAAIGNSPNH